MLRTMSYENLIEKFSYWLTDTAQTKKDYTRLTEGYYGTANSPLVYRESLLFLGIASGLEIVLAKLANPSATIHIVEPDMAWSDKLRRAGFTDVCLYPSFDDYEHAVASRDYDYVRISSQHFSVGIVNRLYDKHTVSSICGELSEIDCNVLSLYRTSRKKCDRFFFRVKDKIHPVAGTRKHDNRPEVTVVVAAYGVEKYIDECIESIVNQTLVDIEILVVDDGSVDSTGKKADEWQQRYPDKLRVIHKENGGCASARQAGLEEARGEYIAFVDGDDWVESPMYEALFESAISHNSEIAQCGFYQFFGDQTKTHYPASGGADGQNGTSGLVYDPACYLTIMPSIWRRIYKADFLKHYLINFPVQIRRYDDMPFGFIALARARRLSVIPDCYYAYRLNRPGQDVAITDGRLFTHFEIFEWLYAQIRPWASQAIMHQLRFSEYASHHWVLNQLDANLKASYLQRALSGTQLRYGMYNVKDDWVAKLNAAASTEKTKQ